MKDYQHQLFSLLVDILGCVCFGWKWFQEIIFRKIGCLVGFENRIFRKSFSFDHKKEALTTEIHFRSYFHFKWFSELRCAKRAHRRAKGERERERTISRTRKGRKIVPSIAISPSCRSRSRETSIAISQSTTPISPSPPPCDLAPRRT